MTIQEKANFLDCLFAYNNWKEANPMDTVRLLWRRVLKQFWECEEKYEAILKERSEAWKRGMKSRRGDKSITKITSVIDVTENITNITDTVTVTDTVNVTNTDTIISKDITKSLSEISEPTAQWPSKVSNSFLENLYPQGTDVVHSEQLETEKEKSSAEKEKEFGKHEINELIEAIKKECTILGVVYTSKNDRNFANHILTAKAFKDFTENIGKNTIDACLSVLRTSVTISYWRWPCSWPESIYREYANVYNQRKQKNEKWKSNIIYSPVL